MDMLKFVNLVYERKCIWDPNDPDYRLRQNISYAWQDVGKEMNMCVYSLKRKWRGLRDTFGRELKRSTRSKTNIGHREYVSKWAYYEPLLFLKDTMTQKVSINNSTTNGLDSELMYHIELLDPDSPGSNSSRLASPMPVDGELTSEINLHSPLSKRIKIEAVEENDERLAATQATLEGENLKHFQNQTNDSDALFLMSLQPFLKDIPKSRKLHVSAKLLQVLIDELDPLSASNANK